MGTRAVPLALAGLVAWFTILTAEAAQIYSRCAEAVAASFQINEAGNQANLIQSSIRESGLRPDELRLHLAQHGYDPSTLNPYLDSVCSVGLPSDSVRLALEALDLIDGSAWVVETALVEPMQSVTIEGEVEQPSSVPFHEGMTLGDLIREAGSLKPTADLTLEVYRVMRTTSRDLLVVPEIHSIRVDSAYLVNHDARRLYARHIAGFTYLRDHATVFKLQPYDRVVANTLRPFDRVEANTLPRARVISRRE